LADDLERLRIVLCLRSGARNVVEIADSLDLEISNAPYHLNIHKQSVTWLAPAAVTSLARFVAFVVPLTASQILSRQK
jgi:hypothetical protein